MILLSIKIGNAWFIFFFLIVKENVCSVITHLYNDIPDIFGFFIIN